MNFCYLMAKLNVLKILIKLNNPCYNSNLQFDGKVLNSRYPQVREQVDYIFLL